MRRNWLIVIAIFLALVLVGLIIKSKFFSQPGFGALSVSTTPKSTVFIDGKQLGTTPFLNDKIVAGEHTVKLISKEKEEELSWEGKVNLLPNTLTVINRLFGETESASSSEIIWLEKIGAKDKSSLAIVSIPDQAVVKLDGQPKDFSPALFENLNPGNYQIVVASPGYEERSVSAKTVAGYKLVINVQLAKKVENIQEPTPSPAVEGEKAPTPSPQTKASPSALEKPYVRIKETPTGWLRVRLGPSPNATEAAKVNPGETYPFLNEKQSGWLKIEYKEGKEGWISGVYAELFE